ncbi:MAG: Rubredoxin [bacterium ADurb.Bin400]|nr:MAG: Rubredoxin [bacterium ADurb.Bin400]
MIKNKEMQQYICPPCGFTYDPAKGDPDGGIVPGTPFADIPENWRCPICGVVKAEFVPVDEYYE